MPSPFPGMDPYLEAHWGDVHSSLVLYSRDFLQARLPGALYARVEERIVVERFDGELARPVPDVRIVEHPGKSRAGGAVGVLDTTDPVVISLPDEELVEHYIEIRDAGSGHQVVTVIEFLSASNKRPGDGRDQYLTKAESLRLGGVSLVEIDLLRTGMRGLPIPDETLLPGQRTAYRAVVKRGWVPRKVEVYPISLRARLPVIRIPLRETDADVPLDLQRVIEQVYENGSYALTTDYSRSPSPPLEEADAAWAKELRLS